MAVTGTTGGVLIAWFTGDRLFNSEASYSAIVLQSTWQTMAIASGAWLTRSRRWRAFAIGLSVTWMTYLALVGLAWTSNDPSPSPGGSPSLVGEGTRHPD